MKPGSPPLAEGEINRSPRRQAWQEAHHDEATQRLLAEDARFFLHQSVSTPCLSAIRRGTLADQLGIKNGDIIHSVNGESLNSMQAAMNAYNTMKTQSSFCFEISRRGTPTELCYDVR